MSNSDSSDRRKSSAAWFLLQGLAEVLATGLLVLVGCSGAMPGLTAFPPTHLQICLVFGLTVMFLVQVFGHISGCHINPAVTLAALIFKEVSLPSAGLYILSQFVGAMLGYGALLFLAPAEAFYADRSNMNVTHGFCTTVPNPTLSTFQGLGAEFLATAILIYVCCSYWDKGNAANADSAPLKFGLTITGLATAFGPFSGGSMNPARSFAPAVFTGVWDRHWIYWLGPLSAALIVSYTYKFTFERYHCPVSHDQAELPLNHLNSKVQNFEKVSNEEAP